MLCVRASWWRSLNSKRSVEQVLLLAVVFGCTICEFKSKKYKLYNEVQQKKPERNPSEINVGLQLALHNTSISTAGARRLLSCLSLPSPSASGMQKAANRFGPDMRKENERDMSAKRNVV